MLCLLPLRVSLWIGRRLGDLTYYLKKNRRKIALINLKAALGANYNYKQLEEITRKTFQSACQTLVELMNFPKINIHYVNKYIKFENLDRIDKALEKGKGVIHLTAHFGNWELSSFAASLKGYHLKVFAREQKYPRLNQLLNKYRELSGCKVIPKGMALRELIRSLHANEIIGMVGDQHAGASGLEINFFNRLASTATGAMEVALRTKAVLLPSFIIRENNIYHRIIVETPLELSDTGNADLDIKNGLEKFNTLLEKYIIKNPEQWLWVHKRWKRTPNRTVVILSDGKAGHLHQSEAVLKIAHDLSFPDLISTKVIEVKFKNKLFKALLPLFDILANFTLFGTKSYFKWALPKNTFLELEKTFADIVISCGSSLSLVNLWLAKDNNARSVIIMKPSFINLKKFDLAIVPEHDHPQRLKNVVITLGPPISIEPKTLLEKGRELKDRFKLSERPKIGVLLGGNTKGYYFEKKDIDNLIDKLKKICSELNLGLLITTSRRTPKEIEYLLKERLANFNNCELLIIANENNFPGAVEGILGLSVVVIVSAESVSMLSEAASSGRSVIAFKPRLKKTNFLFKTTKQTSFLNRLIKEEYVVGLEVDRLAEFIKNRKVNKTLSNKTDILAGLRRIW